MLQRLRIGTRLALAFTTMLLLTALAIGVGLFEVPSVAEQNRQLLAEPLTKERITSDWYRVIDAGSRRTLAMAVSADPVLVSTFQGDMKTATEWSNKYQQQLAKLATSGVFHLKGRS